MLEVPFKRGYLLLLAALAIGFGLYVRGDPFGFPAWLRYLILGALVYLVPQLLWRALVDNVAFRIDTRGADLQSGFSRVRIPWTEVTDVDLRVVTTFAYGFFKVSTSRYLVFKRRGSLFDRQYRFHLDLIDFAGRDPVAVVAGIREVWMLMHEAGTAVAAARDAGPDRVPASVSPAVGPPVVVPPVASTSTGSTIQPAVVRRAGSNLDRSSPVVFGRRRN